MKHLNHRKLVFIFSLLSLSCLPLPAPAQSAPKRHTQSKPDADVYLQQVVATVETRTITRGDVARLYLDYDPKALTQQGPVGTSHPAAHASAEINDLAPQIFKIDPKGKAFVHNAFYFDVPASNAVLHQVALRIFKSDPQGVDAVVETLMRMAALEVAAERRQIHITQAEITAGVHDVLQGMRIAHQLPDVADKTDLELAHRIGTSYNLQWRAVKERMLTRALAISDLSDLLGHAPQNDDFYRAHIILVPVAIKNPRAPEQDWERTRATVEQLRADLLAKKKYVETTARELSDDPTSRRKGDTGPMVRTLLPADMERELLQLQPGEITPPLRTQRGYVLLQLDKRGADLTEQERQMALEVCSIAPKRRKNALARVLKGITWNNTVGGTPEWFRRPAVN